MSSLDPFLYHWKQSRRLLRPFSAYLDGLPRHNLNISPFTLACAFWHVLCVHKTERNVYDPQPEGISCCRRRRWSVLLPVNVNVIRRGQQVNLLEEFSARSGCQRHAGPGAWHRTISPYDPGLRHFEICWKSGMKVSCKWGSTVINKTKCLAMERCNEMYWLDI